MNRYQVSKQVVQIFPAALLSQRKIWQSTIPLLPAHTCLLVTDTSTQKQTVLMRQIAQSFRSGGWQVLIWMTPMKTENLAYQ
jgi:hypothetical protein